MRLTSIAALALTLAACGGGGGQDRPRTVPRAPAAVVNVMDPANWEIGPAIDGKNHSVGLPVHPYAVPDGWAFDLSPSTSVHYVTARLGPLTGKTRLVLDYRIEADPGVELLPSTGTAGMPGVGPTLYFQRSGDDWDTDGWRWWASFASPLPVVPGTFEISVPLDGPWTSVEHMTAASNPAEFAAAKANADRVGFTFGGGTGLGHGLYATGHARVIVTSFRME